MADRFKSEEKTVTNQELKQAYSFIRIFETEEA